MWETEWRSFLNFKEELKVIDIMLQENSISQLRKSQKKVLIERAANAFGASRITDKLKQELINLLLDSNDILSVLNLIKKHTQSNEPETDSLRELNNFKGLVYIQDTDLQFQKGIQRVLTVNVLNQSDATWNTHNSTPLYLSYHWYTAQGKLLELGEVRSALQKAVKPKNVQCLKMNILPPPVCGNYLLQITLVMEGHFWCEDKGLCTLRRLVNIGLKKFTPRAEFIYNKLFLK